MSSPASSTKSGFKIQSIPGFGIPLTAWLLMIMPLPFIIIAAILRTVMIVITRVTANRAVTNTTALDPAVMQEQGYADLIKQYGSKAKLFTVSRTDDGPFAKILRSMPITYGSKILLPPSFFDKGDDDSRRALIAHELEFLSSPLVRVLRATVVLPLVALIAVRVAFYAMTGGNFSYLQALVIELGAFVASYAFTSFSAWFNTALDVRADKKVFLTHGSAITDGLKASYEAFTSANVGNDTIRKRVLKSMEERIESLDLLASKRA